MQPFKVERIEAEKFSQIWNKGGVHVILPPEAIDFASDFANVVLRNFIGMCQAQAQAEVAKQAAKAAEMSKPKIILEGVR